MKLSGKLTSLVAGLLLAGGAVASAQTLDDLKNDGKNTDNILTYGMATARTGTARSSRSTRPTSSGWCRYGISASTINGASRRSRSSTTA